MKLMHLADLHLGKRLLKQSLEEDQAAILEELLHIAAEERPDCVLIAGDVYDRDVPPEWAVRLFDDFLVRLRRLGPEICMISGNHDSAERVAFGGRLLESGGVYVSPMYRGGIEPVVLRDEYGPVKLWPIPYLRPSEVRRFHPEEEIRTYQDAMAVLLEGLSLDPTERNAVLVHQFISGASTCESEERVVGGTDEISGELLECFDYAALGHLHGPQWVRQEQIRYAGSPLKYSFSEAEQEKSVTIVELGPKGSRLIRTVPLKPLRELSRLRGSFEELTATGRCCEDYLEITLTDEEEPLDAAARLRVHYPNLLSLRYDNSRTRSDLELSGISEVERKSEAELFAELFEQQNGRAPTEEMLDYLTGLIADLKEENV